MNLKALITWSRAEFRSLPWRKDHTLYRTLVSEIMLQQTTVGTVKNHFERFLLRFPTLESLAQASEEELLVAWKGLGYYRRARNLKKIAEAVARDHGGEFPDRIEELMLIPGIGPYTANALVGIGMEKRALAVDANLERVIARLLNLKTPKGPKLQKEIQGLFNQKKIFNEKVSYRDLNEALMDLGRTFCQARKASCELCPIKKDCESFKLGNPLNLPLGTKKAENKKNKDEILHLLRVVVVHKNKILVYKKDNSEWLSGQYEVPTFVISCSDQKLKQYPPIKTAVPEALLSFKTSITKYKITNSVVLMTEKEFKKMSFKRKSDWRSTTSENSNLSTATLKAITKIGLHLY